MTTYKLLRIREGRLFPLYVRHKQEMKVGEWLAAETGELADETHVRGRCGPLALRPGFHSTFIPLTDWIGKRGAGGKLYQRKDTVWCECEVSGNEIHVADRNGLRTVPEGWYRFRTNSRQKDPWVISGNIFIRRILSHEEVEEICRQHGLEAQPAAG